MRLIPLYVILITWLRENYRGNPDKIIMEVTNMSFFDTRLWGWIRNNESAYNLIHRTIGMRIRRYYIKDRISGIRKNGVKSIFEIDRVLSDNGFDSTIVPFIKGVNIEEVVL